MFSYKELCGTIHLHTKYSDGGVDYPTLQRTALEVGLNFIIVTDHMSLGGLKDGFEGIKDNLIVIVGYEHQDPDNLNHYLAIGVNEVFDQITDPQDYVNAIRDAGGIGFIAHPAEKRNYIGRFPPYPWTDWNVKGYDGLEIWNQMSEWVERLRSWYSIVKLLYPRRFLDTAPPELLQRWDSLNLNQFIAGIGGVDAHTRKFGKGICSFEVFPIKVELKGLRTHVYVPESTDLGDFEITKKALLNSLKNGNSYISNFRRGDAFGSLIMMALTDGSVVPPGKQDRYCQPESISVSLPEKADIRLLFNGTVIKTATGKLAYFKILDNGVYRVEVYRKEKAWIYSNPFPVGCYPLR